LVLTSDFFQDKAATVHYRLLGANAWRFLSDLLMTPTPTNAYVGKEVAAVRLKIFSIPYPNALLNVSEKDEFQQK
jgi:hypothetical protein